jgi:hypothetical protein
MSTTEITTAGADAATRRRPPLFPLGKVFATPGALEALDESGQSADEFLRRHQRLEVGDLCEEDRRENEFSLVHGFRILSSYRTTAGVKLWLITEADRSSSTLLRPEEY